MGLVDKASGYFSQKFSSLVFVVTFFPLMGLTCIVSVPRNFTFAQISSAAMHQGVTCIFPDD